MLTLAHHFSRLFFLFAESTGLNKSENRNSAFADLAAAAVVWIVSVSGVFDGGAGGISTHTRAPNDRTRVDSVI